MGDYFLHPNALCETKEIGNGTRIGPFACVLDGAVVGRDCNIGSHTYVEAGAVVGDRVTLKNGVHLWDGIQLEDDVFVGPNATFTNHHFSQSGTKSDSFHETIVCRGASIGANATILPGVTVGRDAVIGAGAVVTRSVPPAAVVVGNPGRIQGYASSVKGVPRETEAERGTVSTGLDELGVWESIVKGVTSMRMPIRRDMRGSLIASEFGQEVPFEVKRAFLVFEVPGAEIRGEHAHRECHQFLVCVHGECSVVVDDGEAREEFLLDHPSCGVHIPPMIWSTQFKQSRDAILLVYASHHYDPNDYIRDHQQFMDALEA